MSLADLNREMVKAPKKRAKRSRARVCESPTVYASPIIKSLLDAIDADDVAMVVQVWRDAMQATRSFWRETSKDKETGKSIGSWMTEPDHRTRLEASKMVAAYKEGLPIQRQVQLNANFEDLTETMAKLRTSPAAMSALQALGNSLQFTGESSEKPVSGKDVTEGQREIP